MIQFNFCCADEETEFPGTGDRAVNMAGEVSMGLKTAGRRGGRLTAPTLLQPHCLLSAPPSSLLPPGTLHLFIILDFTRFTLSSDMNPSVNTI